MTKRNIMSTHKMELQSTPWIIPNSEIQQNIDCIIVCHKYTNYISFICNLEARTVAGDVAGNASV